MTRRFTLPIAAAVVSWAIPLPATAAMELYLSDSSGDSARVEIAPGQSFQVQVGFATTEPAFGLSYWLSISENGSGWFSLTGREIPSDCAFPDLTTSGSALLEPAAALLDPSSDRDLGALTNDASIPQPAGLYALATLTLSSTAGVSSGTYVLAFKSAGGTNADMENSPITTHSYTIVVTDGSSGSGDTGSDTGNTGGGTSGTDGDAGNTGDDTADTEDAIGENGDSGSGDTSTDSETGIDAETGQNEGTDTGSDESSVDTQDEEDSAESTSSVLSTGRCGTGSGAVLALSALVAACFVRPTGRRA